MKNILIATLLVLLTNQAYAQSGTNTLTGATDGFSGFATKTVLVETDRGIVTP